jgi:hypothetical protein
MQHLQVSAINTMQHLPASSLDLDSGQASHQIKNPNGHSRKRQRSEESLPENKKKRGKENCAKPKARSSRRSVKPPKKFCPSEEAAKPQWSDIAACAKTAAQEFDKIYNGATPKQLIGRNVRKFFSGHGWFRGQVTAVKRPTKKGAEEVYNIEYSDGDTEEYARAEVLKLLSAPLMGDDHQVPVKKFKPKKGKEVPADDADFEFELSDMRDDFTENPVPLSYPFQKENDQKQRFYSQRATTVGKRYRVRKVYNGEQRPYIDEGQLDDVLRAQMQEELDQTGPTPNSHGGSSSLWGQPKRELPGFEIEIKTEGIVGYVGAKITTPTAVTKMEVQSPPPTPASGSPGICVGSFVLEASI